MGLDQYAYVAAQAGERDAYYDADGSFEDGEWVVPGKTKPREIAYWRKHPNLQGWMEFTWKRKLIESKQEEPNDDGWGSSFNGIELELTLEDLDALEQDVLHGRLPKTSGFFFGNDSDDHYKQHDLEFIKQARVDIASGLKVFYNSSW